MLETRLKDPRDHKIAELERELAIFQGFTISHMLANKIDRLVTFSPFDYKDLRKVIFTLKREEIEGRVALVGELIIKDKKDH